MGRAVARLIRKPIHLHTKIPDLFTKLYGAKTVT
jgi:hypothetical protein